ncbi:MAG: ferredoxin [Synoicihabitans sp.]
MPDKNNRLTINSPGSFYVDDSCIDCDLCRSNAPEFFIRDDDLGFSFVHRQPVSDEDVEQAKEALEECPSGSIGDDG